MFELYLGRKVYERFQTTEESNASPVEEKTSAAKTVLTIVYITILVGIGAYGAYISWAANTLAGWGTVAKVIFSLFAFLFGLSYLITYFIHKLDLVNMILILKGTYQEYNGAIPQNP
jgi:hypothetical protein